MSTIGINTWLRVKNFCISVQVIKKSSVVVWLAYWGRNVDSTLGSRIQIRINAVEAHGFPTQKKFRTQSSAGHRERARVRARSHFP